MEMYAYYADRRTSPFFIYINFPSLLIVHIDSPWAAFTSIFTFSEISKIFFKLINFQ